MIISVEEDKKKLRWVVEMVHNNKNASEWYILKW